MKTFAYCFAVAFLLVALPKTGQAQTLGGGFRLHLDTVLFGFGTGGVNPEFGRELEFDSASVGLGVPSAGIGFGYAVIDNLVIGGKITLGLEGLDKYHVDDQAFVWSILPYVEYVFLDGLFRPFVIGILGFEGYASDSYIDSNWWGFTFGGGGGAHLFFFDIVSFDATVLFTFNVGTGEERIADQYVAYDHWRFVFSTLIGMSVWF